MCERKLNGTVDIWLWTCALSDVNSTSEQAGNVCELVLLALSVRRVQTDLRAGVAIAIVIHML